MWELTSNRTNKSLEKIYHQIMDEGTTKIRSKKFKSKCNGNNIHIKIYTREILIDDSVNGGAVSDLTYSHILSFLVAKI